MKTGQSQCVKINHDILCLFKTVQFFVLLGNKLESNLVTAFKSWLCAMKNN